VSCYANPLLIAGKATKIAGKATKPFRNFLKQSLKTFLDVLYIDKVPFLPQKKYLSKDLKKAEPHGIFGSN